VKQFSPQEVISWDAAKWKQLAVTSTQTPKWPNIGTLSSEHTVYTGKAGEDRLCIYDYATGKKLGRLAAPGTQNPAALGFFSPSGGYYVLLGVKDKGGAVIRVFAVPSCKLLCELPSFNIGGGPFPGVFFSPEERLIAFFSYAGEEIQVCDTLTGLVKQRLGKLPDGETAFKRLDRGNIAFSPDCTRLAAWTLADDAIRIWDLTTGKERLRLPATERGRRHVPLAWSPDSRMLAVADRKIQLIEVATGRVRQELDGHQASVRAIAFSPDGRLLASGSGDTTVLIWDVWGR